MSPDVQIRLCRPRDESALYGVCLQTGEGGKDATHLYADPKALGEIYVGPYINLEPELAFALEDRTGICGYVLGARDSKRFYQAYVEEWLPQLQQRYPEPRGDPATWTPTERIYSLYHHPDIYYPEPYETYPSHLHIDLLPRARGRGIGTSMVEHLVCELIKAGSPGVHLGMDRDNAGAERFYKRLGFAEVDRRGDTLYLARRFSKGPAGATCGGSDECPD